MSFHQNNKWLMDVLEKGPASPFAAFFDIDWNHPHYRGKLMVPFPGSELEKILKERFSGEHFVLCSWQETDYRMNYRRFFLVNTLICTNIQDDNVFQSYHQLTKKLLNADVFQGLRIDHVDGLYDPTKYLMDLRALSGDRTYIIVEKILEPGEKMPEHWPIQGNSGYDFLGIINNLFTNRSGEFDLTSFYYDITRDGTPIEEQVHEKKKMILMNHMQGELENLTRLYRAVSGVQPNEQSDEALKAEIAAYMINCPVYRYYDDIPMMEIDKGRDKQQMKRFYQRCMQFTGPLMAKGVEDTLMYTYNRFIGHNEVGDSSEFFGYTTEEFHGMMKERQTAWPLAMNSTSTHDTKRGEDVRARLNVLTDISTEWVHLVAQWQRQNAPLKTNSAPDNNDEYFIYQTLVGSYPLAAPDEANAELDTYAERIAEYLQKSLREAKVHSTWTNVNESYEKATIAFARQLIHDNGGFMKSFLPFVRHVADFGMINSFGQLTLKMTCPGVPDVYQGTELWDLSLVDPDNRRPVDYERRLQMLTENEPLPELWKSRWTGKIKLQLLHRLMMLRNQHEALFVSGDYIPLQLTGRFKQNAIAYLRKHGNNCILVAVPLHLAALPYNNDNATNFPRVEWEDTKIVLPPNAGTLWEDVLTEGVIHGGNEISLIDLFSSFPVAVLKTAST
jgi:maltooligosyltrehalose synthase